MMAGRKMRDCRQLAMNKCPYTQKGDGFRCEFFRFDRLCDKIPYSDFVRRMIEFEEREDGGVGEGEVKHD